MRMQVEPVAEAVVMEVEDQVTATGTPPLVDKDLVAQLVGDAQRLGCRWRARADCWRS